MAHRVNFILDKNVWEMVKAVPQGERSRLVNVAIKEWFNQKKRKKATQNMDQIRNSLQTFSSKEILQIIRSDRSRH